MGNSRIAILTPHGSKERWGRFSDSLDQIDFTGFEAMRFPLEQRPWDAARNALAAQFLRADRDLHFDWVAWFDDDTRLPPHTIRHLVSHDLDMVCGIYFQRHTPYSPQIFRDALEPEYKGRFWSITDYPDDELIRIDGCGFGCVLMKPWVLREIKPPPFIFGGGFLGFRRGLGEDLYFCHKVRKQLGVQIWCDTGVKCGHRTEIEATEETFKPLRHLIKKVYKKEEGDTNYGI